MLHSNLFELLARPQSAYFWKPFLRIVSQTNAFIVGESSSAGQNAEDVMQGSAHGVYRTSLLALVLTA